MCPKLYRARLGVLFAATALTLAACGGGDDDESPAPAPGPGPDAPPASKTLTGQVTRNGALKNVVVCLDLNNNSACDTGEPASQPTGADGRYALTYQTAAVSPAQAQAATLIAPVHAGDATAPGTAIDMVSPTTAATPSGYVLKRAAGTTGNINPLTTLVQAGVAAGMTDAVARENVSKQLGVDAAKIDDYQNDPPSTSANVQDTARVAAILTASALRDKATLEVGDQSAAVGAGAPMLNNLWFGDSGNFYIQTLDRVGKPAGPGSVLVTDARAGKTNGTPRADTGDANALYRSAYLTPSGWKLCDRSSALHTLQGNPSRSTTCGARVSVGYTTSSSIADQPMGDLVTRWQGQDANSINPGASTANLLAALGNTRFPSGSAELRRSSLIVEPGLMIDDVWRRGLAQATATTLQGLLAAFPVSGVNLATGGGTLSLGNGTGPDKTMRVAFGAATSATTGEAQYYQCDLDQATQTFAKPPNCTATAKGSYTISTVHGAPVMQFAGAPATVMNFDVAYAEVDWGGENRRWVYRVHELKPSLNARGGSINRLNGPAWAAMKAQLGL